MSMTYRKPLEGIRVVDLTSVIMGPFATHILADLGADVIKVEGPDGDSLRAYQPQRGKQMSGSFLNLNRNKRSICLDLKTVAGRSAFDRLLVTADVFVHNLRKDSADRLGYSYERVRELNAQIVYCRAQGFGSEGPYAKKPAYDDIIQAGAGIASLFSTINGAPAYVPTVVCDKLAGQAVAYAIIAGLFHRQRGGGGQYIEVPMFETSVEFNFIEHMAGFAFLPPLGPPEFARVLNSQRKPYRTRDGHICLLPYSDKNWRDFYRFTGRTEFEHDERFHSLSHRVQNIQVLYQMLEEEAAKRTNAEWIAFCDESNIPCMPVIQMMDLPDDRHIAAVGLFVEAQHPSEGPYRIVRQPITFGDVPFEIVRHAPKLGEHTADVLKEIGLSPEEIAATERQEA